MTMKTPLKSAMFLACALFAAPAFAAVDVDADGVGFIGKGDVQLAMDWNNHELQANAYNLTFAINGGVTVTTWDCVHTNPAGHVVRNPRNNTTSLSATLFHEVRANKQGQVTGFFAVGYDPDTASGNSSGHPLGSCPSGNGSVVDQDSVVVVDSGDATGLSVSADDGASWFAL
jgi:hypothetical protein